MFASNAEIDTFRSSRVQFSSVGISVSTITQTTKNFDKRAARFFIVEFFKKCKSI